MSEDAIVFLELVPPRHLGKTFKADGTEESYALHARGPWRVLCAKVTSLAQLPDVLQRLPQTVMHVRGVPIVEGADEIYRRARNDDLLKGPATLKETDHHLIPVDVDGGEWPANTLESLENRSETARALCPSPFNAMPCVAVYTSGSTIRPGLRVRLWFWSDVRLTDEQCRYLFQRPVFDPRIYYPEAITYTANPVFEAPRIDPIPDRKPIYLPARLSNANTQAQIPEKTNQTQIPNQAFKALGTEENQNRIKWADATLDQLLEALESLPQGSRNQAMRYIPFRMAAILSAQGASDDDLPEMVWALAEPRLEVRARHTPTDMRSSRADITSAVRKHIRDRPARAISITDFEPDSMPTDAYGATELAVAHRLNHILQDFYCAPQPENPKDRPVWREWQGTHWSQHHPDEAIGHVLKGLEKHYRALAKGGHTDPDQKLGEAEYEGMAARLHSYQTITKVEALSRGASKLQRISTADMDSDAWLLNFRNGTFDVRDGTLHQHHPRNYITSVLPYDYRPDATCPTWDKALALFSCGDPEWIELLRWFTSTCLHGEASQYITLFTGDGGTGKSTIANVIAQILRPYVGVVPHRVFIDPQAHSSKWARHHRKRMLGCFEVPTREPLNLDLVKALSGDDLSSGQEGMGVTDVDFRMSGSVLGVLNGIARLLSQDRSIRRRFVNLPFEFEIPLSSQLRANVSRAPLLAEASGIMNWMLRGLQYQVPPYCGRAVKAMETVYEENNPLYDWMAECTERSPEFEAQSTALYENYKMWCRSNSQRHMHNGKFYAALKEQGHPPHETSKCSMRQGIRLKLTGVVPGFMHIQKGQA